MAYKHPRHALDPTITTLTCKQCGETKAAHRFRKDTSIPGGYRRHCLDCRAAYKQRYDRQHTAPLASCPHCGRAMSAKARQCITCRRRDAEARRREAEAKRNATEQALRAAWMAERRITIAIAVANEAQNLAAIKARMAERRRLAREERERPVTKRAVQERAKEAVKLALRTGTMSRPDRCQGCREPKPVQGHHPSYLPEDRLKVRWLCAKCHHREHRMIKRGEAEPIIYPSNAI